MLIENKQEQYLEGQKALAKQEQAWQKGVRRERKEIFKVQSTLIKTQEELKSCRMAQKAAEDELYSERERGKAREQEAFDAEYSLVGLQEQLDQALARAKMLEQELAALRTLAKNDTEVQGLGSAEPSTEEHADSSEGPRKRPRLSEPSAASDDDLDTLKMLWQWEKHRADRALDQVDFLETECQLKMCSGAKSLRQSQSSGRSSPRLKRASMLISDAGDSMILSESRQASMEPSRPTPRRSKTDVLRGEKESRRSTIFLPAEGIFRTVSQAEADAIMAESATSSVVSPTEPAASVPITPTDSNPLYRRTPSLEPPDFAMLAKQRTSLLSLLDAPHRQDPTPIFNIPTVPGPEPATHHLEDEDDTIKAAPSPPRRSISPIPPAPRTDALPSTHSVDNNNTSAASSTTTQPTRPHTTASHYPAATTTVTTTTKVPLREEPADGPTLAQRLMKMQRTPSRNGSSTGSNEDSDRPSFDASNPALTPTMTREQALQQIRERRGRAKSVVSGGHSASVATTGTGRKVSGGSGTGAAERRKVSGGTGAGAAEVRRKASGELGGTTRREEIRGREREVRREVSAPTAGAGGAGRRGVSAVRRVRS